MKKNCNCEVMHLTTAHPRDDIRIFHKMVRHLHFDGFSTCLAVSDGLGNAVQDGIDIFDVGKKSNRFLRFLLTPLSLFLLVNRKKPIFVHFHDPDFIIMGYILSLMGYKVVYDVHEDIPRQILAKTWLPSQLRKYISIAFEYLESLLSKQFYGVITATEHISERFVQYNGNVKTVKNYPILKEFGYSSSQRKERTLCYIGSISEGRGIIELLETLELLPDYELVIAGSFESQATKDKVTSMKSWERVDYRGRIGREDISTLLSECSIGIVTLHPLPNYLDSLPIKMFEYMASGLPIVASNFPHWLSLVEGNNVGLCADPLNVYDIKKKVILVNSNLNKYKNNGINVTKLKYSWEKEYEKLKSIYEK